MPIPLSPFCGEGRWGKRSCCLLLFLISLSAFAQGDYNPTNPPEPNTLYKVTTTAENGYASGAGSYKEGTQVYLRCSSGGTNFFFKHWLKNGEVYGTSQNFYYTAQAANADFVAVFEFLPPSPNEPQTPPNIHRLYLQSSPEGACSFNRSSGERFEEDQYVSVTAYPSQNFDFQGWYRNGGQVSTAQGFNYLMPTEDVTLTARFVYNPVNPSEPESPGEPTTVRGDADGDGSVDVTDAVSIVNMYLGN